MARYHCGMNVHTPKPDKYKAYRERKKAAGLKQVRLWTIDINAPGMREKLAADAERLRGLESEREAMDFLEALGADAIRDLPR